MKILVDIGHPAHVHFYKNFIWEMKKRGHEIIVTARDKDVALDLLKAYGIPYTAVGKMGKGKFNLIKEWIGRDWAIYQIARKNRIQLLTGIHNPCVAHVARLTGAKAIIFTDSEPTQFASAITFPFSDVICTPTCFRHDLGRKQIRFNGYKELAYLHPNWFAPDPSVLHNAGLSQNEKYVVVRFIAWQASHDVGRHGFDLAAKRELVQQLSKYAKVLITSENPLPSDFEEYRVGLSPEKMHDLLIRA